MPTATATSAASAVIAAGTSAPAGLSPVNSLWQWVLCDRNGGELADITGVAFNKKLSFRLSRPAMASFDISCDSALARTLAGDGEPFLSPGSRSLKVRRRGTPMAAYVLKFNGIVWTLEDSGDEDTARTTVTCFDPLITFRYRPVRDATGNFSNPDFGTPVSGGSLIQQAFNASIVAGDPSVGEGPMGLGSGTFDTAIPPAIDLSMALMDYPIMMADLLTLVTDTGVCDVTVTPVDSGSTMGQLNAVNRAGADRPFVHFDYGLGDYSIAQIRRSQDMETIGNKIWYYLGPRAQTASATFNLEHWAGNITADDPNLPDPPQTAIAAAIAASRAAYGVFMDIHVYDDLGTENTVRPLFQKLWQTDSTLRVGPRELLYITPVRESPFVDALQLGDTITVNCTDVLRQGFTGTQRVYGWDIEIDDDGVEALTELVTSADAE